MLPQLHHPSTSGATVARFIARRPCRCVKVLQEPATKPWTDAERDELRRLWGQVSGYEIARRLGRGYSAVCYEARKLGLKRLKGKLPPMLRDGTLSGDGRRFTAHPGFFSG
ncbi:MAG: hypothetical protein KGL39_54965 [Patescibacteria group bacterium]|nr:hypothetical protein [Patescibacteria group bacterium]